MSSDCGLGAIKYNRPSGSVHVSASAAGETVAVQVRDTGTGLGATELSRLFVEFERLGAEKSGIPGTGLGLVLSKRLAEAMGAEIRVTSEVGRGSTFTLLLRRAESSVAEVQEQSAHIVDDAATTSPLVS